MHDQPSIAIIEDNQVNLQFMSMLVEKHFKCTPHTFVDAWIGLEWCLINAPDVVVIDYMMPTLDGLGFINTLRRSGHCEDTQIIMVTSSLDAKLRYDALDAGANDFLTKPIDSVEFRVRLKNLVAVARGAVALRDRASWLATEVAKATEEIRQSEREAIHLLSRAAEYRDPETGGHIIRMATYSMLIADEIQLEPKLVDLIKVAAPMHDIGKVATPDRILLKPGRLDPDEMVIMREHARAGYEILRHTVSPLMQLAASIALHHHEKFDGSGYPSGLAKEAIPIEGRIVAVADVFDALTSPRPYKQAWEFERAVEYIRAESGKHFDPRLVVAFNNRLGEIREIHEQHKD